MGECLGSIAHIPLHLIIWLLIAARSHAEKDLSHPNPSHLREANGRGPGDFLRHGASPLGVRSVLAAG